MAWAGQMNSAMNATERFLLLAFRLQLLDFAAGIAALIFTLTKITG